MKNIDQIASTLSGLKKENPFETPDGYFESFSGRLHDRLSEEQAVPPSGRSFLRILKPAMGLAASFAVILMLVYFPLQVYLSADNQGIATEFSGMDILNIFEEMDEATFFAALDDDADTNNGLSSDDLMPYLYANFTDYEIFENLAK